MTRRWAPQTRYTLQRSTGSIIKDWIYLISTKNEEQTIVKNRIEIVALGFGEWSSWSQCTNLCGSGLRYRLRDCEAPPCSGSSFELSECQSFELC